MISSCIEVVEKPTKEYLNIHMNSTPGHFCWTKTLCALYYFRLIRLGRRNELWVCCVVCRSSGQRHWVAGFFSWWKFNRCATDCFEHWGRTCKQNQFSLGNCFMAGESRVKWFLSKTLGPCGLSKNKTTHHEQLNVVKQVRVETVAYSIFGQTEGTEIIL